MMCAVSLVTMKMACFRSHLQIIAHKFAIGLMSGELPGQYKTKMFLFKDVSSLFLSNVECQILLKNALTTGKFF